MEARANNVEGTASFGGDNALANESQDTIEKMEEAALKAKWKKYYI